MVDKVTRLLSNIMGKLNFHLEEQKMRNFVQFMCFCMVGVTNTLVSYGINIVTLLFLKPLNISWDFIVGNIVAFILSVLWSFYWNNRLVFTVEKGERRSTLKTLLKTYLAYGFTGILLNNILSLVWIQVLGISKFIAPLFNLIISVPINYLINKLWAFKTDRK